MSPMPETRHPEATRLAQRVPPRLARWATEVFIATVAYPNVEAWILFAIMDRESLGGDALQPKGARGQGDNGHGRGLCQIDDRAHFSFTSARFDDRLALWQEPVFNVLYAARLLHRNLIAAKGDHLVAIAAYNCGLTKALQCALQARSAGERLAALDKCTTGGNYVSDVLRRRSEYLSGGGVPNV